MSIISSAYDSIRSTRPHYFCPVHESILGLVCDSKMAGPPITGVDYIGVAGIGVNDSPICDSIFGIDDEADGSCDTT